MRWLRNIVNFYLDASIHVALSLVSLVIVTYHYLHLPVNWYLCLFLFFTTIASYNFIKYGPEAEKYLLVANKYHRLIQLMSLAMLIPAIYFSSYFSLAVWIGLLILAILVALYTLPVLPKEHSFRTWGNIKIAIVALVWSGTSVILPVLASEEGVNFDVFIEATQRFLFVIALMIPFEIRDLNFDRPDLGTLPQKFGIIATKRIGYIILCIAFLLTYFKDDLITGEVLQKIMIFGLLSLLIGFSNPDRKKVYSSFWVEGLPLLWAGLIILCW